MCFGALYTTFTQNMEKDYIIILMNSYASMGIIGISYCSLLYSLKKDWFKMNLDLRDFLKTLMLSCAGLIGAAFFYSLIN